MRNFDPAQSHDEDEETLAAIDEGISDAKAVRVVPADEVRKLLPQWIIASSVSQSIEDVSLSGVPPSRSSR